MIEMPGLREIKDSFLHLFFPHVCSSCGNDVLSRDSQLCLRCLHHLPETNFEFHSANPVEKIFWGRLPLNSASAQFYFTKESMMQRLLHLFKYKRQRELGLQLGRLMGIQLARSNRFPVEGLVPLPLFLSREKRRGYNQAAVLCEGIAEALQVPVFKNAIGRPQSTETQTRKNRMERWMNMENRFELSEPSQINHKHILLVDDVITTGATLEACGQELLKAENIKLSIATLCFASK